MYNGLGHEEGFLNFYPFSAGERSCPAKNLGLQVIRKVVVTNFHHFVFLMQFVRMEDEGYISHLITLIS